MSAETIAAITATQASAIAPIPPPQFSSSSPVNGSFGQLIEQGLNQVNEQLMTSQADLQSLALGDVQNLHQLMIRLEESRISFQLMMQIRSRALEAYQDIMRMPI